ncbi:MAG: hypothetical protein K2X47_03750 [Bdellovibrionales bacterium]|nr:hypothetical protein [Bdellovibrionales bacterium]
MISSFIGFVTTVLLAVSVFGSVKPQEWVREAQSTLVEVKTVVLEVPYREAQHTKLKAYFATISELVEVLINDEKQFKKISEYFRKAKGADLCSQLFMQKSEWEAVMKSCQRNSFFICSEEIQVYPNQIEVLDRAIPSLGAKRCAGFVGENGEQR